MVNYPTQDGEEVDDGDGGNDFDDYEHDDDVQYTIAKNQTRGNGIQNLSKIH